MSRRTPSRERRLIADLVGDMRAGLDALIKQHPDAAQTYLKSIEEHRRAWALGHPEPPLDALLREFSERTDAALQECQELVDEIDRIHGGAGT